MTFLLCLPLEVLSSNLTEPKPAQTCLIFETLVNKNKDWKRYCKNKWWNIVCSYFYLIRDLIILSCSDDLSNSVCCFYLMFSVDFGLTKDDILNWGGWLKCKVVLLCHCDKQPLNSLEPLKYPWFCLACWKNPSNPRKQTSVVTLKMPNPNLWICWKFDFIW